MQSFNTCRRRLETLMILPLIAGLTSPVAGQCEFKKLLASDGAADDFFGRSVSITGTPGNEVAIIGAYRDDSSGEDSGSAYIYRFNGSLWVAQAKLLASDGAPDDRFGQSISISGDPGNEVAIVGAPGDSDNGLYSGSAYIYRFNGEIWVEEAKLLASDGSKEDSFGWSVSINSAPGNEVAIVGAVFDSDQGMYSGSAYVFRFNGSAWVEEQKLLASDAATDDRFAISVSISGTTGNDVAVVGAYQDDGIGTDSGSAYVFRMNSTSWVEESKLLASDGAGSAEFGRSVSISGHSGNEVVIVGANGVADNGYSAGAAYIYRYNSENWVEETKLLASDGTAGDWFGNSVAICGSPDSEVAIVGAYLDDDNGPFSGSAFIYRFNGASWIEESKLLASDGAGRDYFGWSVAINGASGNEVAFVGAWGNADNGTNSGSAYIFTNLTSFCPADTDCDASVGVVDLLTLLAGWGPNPGHPADFNRDGSVDVLDLLTLLTGWGACP